MGERVCGKVSVWERVCVESERECGGEREWVGESVCRRVRLFVGE